MDRKATQTVMDTVLTEPRTSGVIPADLPQKSKSKRGGFRAGAGRPTKNPPADKINVTEFKSRVPSSKLFLPPLPLGRNARSVEMIKWWIDLTTDQLKHLAIYVYRTWPMYDAKRFDPKAQTNIKLFTGACPFTAEHWDRDIMTEFGSGDYRFSINEDSIHRWDVYIKGLRDLENFPPLMDERLLMLDEPSNKDYIMWARNRGRLQGINLPEQEDSMAANTALERMAETTDRLTDKVIDLADRAVSRQPNDNGNNSIEAMAQRAIIQTMNEASSKTMDTVIRIIDRQAEMKDNQNDPLAMVDKIVQLTAAMTGGSNRSESFMQQMLDTEREQRRMLQEELKEMRTFMMKRDEHRPENVDDPLGLNKLVGLKNTLTELGLIKSSSNETEDDAAASSKSTNIKTMLIEGLMRNLPAIVGNGGLNGLVVNLSSMLSAVRQPPQMAQQTVTTQPSIGQSSQTVPATAPGTSPQPDNQIDSIIKYVAQITPPMLHHMNAEGLDGYTFARWLIDSDRDGRQNYKLMQEAGAESLIGLMQMYAPLWSVVSKMPSALNKFIAEFLRYDEWVKEQDEDGDDADTVEGVVVK